MKCRKIEDVVVQRTTTRWKLKRDEDSKER